MEETLKVFIGHLRRQVKVDKKLQKECAKHGNDSMYWKFEGEIAGMNWCADGLEKILTNKPKPAA